MTDTAIGVEPGKAATTRGVRSERRLAVTVGALYIATTVAGLLAAATLGSLLDGPDALAGLADHKTRVMASSFFQLVMAVRGAGIAFMFSPVLTQDADTRANWALRAGTSVPASRRARSSWWEPSASSRSSS